MTVREKHRYLVPCCGSSDTVASTLKSWKWTFNQEPADGRSHQNLGRWFASVYKTNIVHRVQSETERLQAYCWQELEKSPSFNYFSWIVCGNGSTLGRKGSKNLPLMCIRVSQRWHCLLDSMKRWCASQSMENSLFDKVLTQLKRSGDAFLCCLKMPASGKINWPKRASGFIYCCCCLL